MPWDSDNNCWSSNYWPPRNQNVTFRQKSPPQPTYTRLPALLKTIEEAPAAVLRDSLVHLCRKSAADAENVCKALADPVEPVSKPLDENDEARDDEFEEEETDAIELLLERALEHRQRQLRTRQPNSDQKRSPSSRGSSESNTGESSSDASSEAKPTVPKAAYQTLINGRICPEQQTPKPKGLAVDDIGPSGKCSSYAYSKNPHCAQRTDKAYIDAIRKKLDKNPQRSRQELINAEKKLEKDRWEMEFEASMRVLNSLPRRNEKCQHCKEIFDATWNDYESCTWHPGTLEPDYEGWWPEKWDREDEEVDFDIIESMFQSALEQDRDDYVEYFKWDCCQKNGCDDGCEMGRHVGPGDDPERAKSKRRRRR